MTQKDYKELVKKAVKAREAYYVLSAPIMSDSEYNAIERQIENIESQHPEWVVATSPTQTVGFSYTGGSKMGHKYPMLSVKKAYGFDELQAATDKMAGATEFCIEWKYDGISCSLVYVDGDLVQAGTRGDGIVGQDITDVVWGMNEVPKHINAMGRTEIRGEVVMTEDVYERNFADIYAGGRNAASTLAQSGRRENGKYLSFRAWQGMGSVFAGVEKQSERIEMMKGFGFKVSGVKVASGMEQLKAVIERMSAQAEGLDVYVDGIVVKVNDMHKWMELGATKTSPKYAVAYKWDCTKVAVKVTEIEMREAASGRVTPVIWFEPVDIDGCYYDHVSGGSVKCVEEKGIKVGCYVEVGVQGGTSIKLFGAKADALETGTSGMEPGTSNLETGTSNLEHAPMKGCSFTGFGDFVLGLGKVLKVALGAFLLVGGALMCAVVGVNFMSSGFRK